MPPNGGPDSDAKRTILKLFDLGELIAAPVTALLDADYQSARRVIELIQYFGFEPPEPDAGERTADEDGFPRRFGRMRTVSFVVRRQERGRSVPYVIRVPLLSLVPMPLLQIKEADFDFSVRVVGAFVEGSADAGSDEPRPPVTRDMALLGASPSPGSPDERRPAPRKGPPTGVTPLRRRRRRRPKAAADTMDRGAGLMGAGVSPGADSPRGRPPAEEEPQRLFFSATLGRDGGGVAPGGTASLRAEGNMKVHTTMRQGDMPEGIAQILNMLSQQISREELPEPGPAGGAARERQGDGDE